MTTPESSANSFDVPSSGPTSAGLVAAALGMNGSVSTMLEYIAKEFSAFGCVLWEVTNPAELECVPPHGSAFVLADWFDGDVAFSMHDLPVSETATGRVIIENRPANLTDVRIQGGVTRNHNFLLRNNVSAMMSAPIRFPDGNRGAINVYRRECDPAFSEGELKTLVELASIAPHLYQATRDRVGLELLRQVDSIIRESEVEANSGVMPKLSKQAYLKRICDLVAQILQCLEVSIFLKDRHDRDGWYALQATTWKTSLEAQGYEADAKSGVTGWVLENRTAVRLLDLRDYVPGATKEEASYPGLSWKRSQNFLSQIDEQFPERRKGEHPPICYLAAPSMIGEEVLGVIRCCTARRSPYYFSARELGMLKLVAAQVGQCWSTWLSRRMLQTDKSQWQAVVTATNELNTAVQTELSKEAPNLTDILDRALSTLSTSLRSNNDALDVRLIDRERKKLYFAATLGAPWRQGTQSDIECRRKLEFSVADRQSSVGAKVYHESTVYHSADLSQDKLYGRSGVFPNARRLITAPILVGEMTYGVLDLLGHGDADFPPHAVAFVELLGKQLGLYMSLLSSIERLRSAEAAAKDSYLKQVTLREEQQRLFEDLSHQLKGPIRLARGQAKLVLDECDTRQIGRREMQALHGLIRKADRVTKTMRLLSEVEQGKAVTLDRSTLESDQLVPMLIEAARDAEEHLAIGRGIRFTVEREVFWGRHTSRVSVDYDLLEQAIGNLADNAAKYSYPDTTVIISGGLTGSGRFQISFANRGLKIRPVDIGLCSERGWRSNEAQWTTGEGSGLGLWIVKSIMSAHGGSLIIDPTNADGINYVRLVFPYSS